MKNSNFFWQHWSVFEKRLYLSLLGLLVLTVLFFTASYYNGSSLIIEWLHKTGLKTVVILFDNYHVGLYDFPIKAESLAITQSFVPSDLIIREWPATILLVVFSLGLVVLLALITTLNRFWYLASMGIFAALLIFLKLDMLHFFGAYNKVGLIVAFLLFYPVSYYFQYTSPSASLSKRLSLFLIAMILLVLFVSFFADVNHKVIHTVNYGIYVPLVIAVIFIFMVGHEVISTLLKAISGTGKNVGKNHLFHFLLLSVLYLLNVLLVYLRNSRQVDLGIYIIDSFWLLLIAAVAGIWGFQDRESTYAGIFPFKPIGGLLYLTLATISFTTIAYFFLSGNDSFIEVIEDAITFSQLGYGVIFIIYILANFFPLLYDNIGMAKVMYKPRHMPYFTARLMGFIAVMGLFLMSGKIAYHQAIAGYYSGIGDIYYINQEAPAAKEYYKLANNFSATSHRANFALASIEKNEGNTGTALNYLLTSVKKNPTEYAFAGIADIYSSHNKYFDALFTLRKGIETFPESGPLNNNLGLTFAETDILDSTFYFLGQAQKLSATSNIAVTNLLAIFASENLPIRGDSLQELAQKTKYLPLANNLQVLASVRQTRVEDSFSIKFTAGNTDETEQILYNYNKLLTHSELLDTGYWSQLAGFYNASSDYWMQEQLTLAGALAAFATGEKTTAFNTFHGLLNQTDTKIALYSGYLGRMSLASGAPKLAVQHFERAIANGNQGVFQEYAFALTESGDYTKALNMWKYLAGNENGDLVQLATGMIKLLSAKDVKEMLKENPLSQYNFIRYRSAEMDKTNIDAFILSIENNNFRAACWLEMSKKKLKAGNTGEANEYLQRLESTPFNNPYLRTSYLKLQILLQIQNGNVEELRALLKDTEPGDKMLKCYLELAHAWLKARSGASLDADGLYKSVGYKDPFFEPAVLEAAAYFSDIRNDNQIAYDLLLNAANINIYSLEIQKAYILQCLRIGMNQYAEEAMNELKLFAPKEDMEAFISLYNNLKSKTLRKNETW